MAKSRLSGIPGGDVYPDPPTARSKLQGSVSPARQQSMMPKLIAGYYGLSRDLTGGIAGYLKENALFGLFDDVKKEPLTDEQMQEEFASRAVDLISPMVGNVSKVAVNELKGLYETIDKKLPWDEVKDLFRKGIPRQGEVGQEIANLSPRTRNLIFRPQDKQVTKGYTPSDYFKVLKDDPWFQSLKMAKPNGEGVFDQLKVMSEIERAYPESQRFKTYSSGLGVKGSTTSKTRQSAAIDVQSKNTKTESGEILSSDTVRGCGNSCNTCFANTGCAQTNIKHNEPVPAKLKGKVKEGQILRVGTNGDPALNWEHSNEQIKDVFARSKGNVSPEKNMFGVTKLQSIEGFDPSVWRNLEVSLDPLNPEHMRITMNNIQRLKKMDPDINISARIRSYKSNNPALQKSLDQAVEFADYNKLEILETKMRFKNQEYEDILDLDKSAYKGKGAQRVYDGESILKETHPDAQKKITVCGEGGLEKCVTCRGCEKLGTKTLSKDWQPDEKYIKDLLKNEQIEPADYDKAMKWLQDKEVGSYDDLSGRLNKLLKNKGD